MTYRIPATYDEFYARYPKSIRVLASWLLRMKGRDEEQINELEQILHTHLLEKQIIEKFDSSRYGETEISEKMFFNFLKLCVSHKSHDIWARSQAHRRSGEEVGLDMKVNDTQTVEDTLVVDSRLEERADASSRVNRLRDHIRRHGGRGGLKLLEVLDQRLLGRTLREIAVELEISYQAVGSRWQRIQRLCAEFDDSCK